MLYTHYYLSFFFFFNDTATTEIYTLSLHDALPICREQRAPRGERPGVRAPVEAGQQPGHGATGREDQLERVQVPVRGEEPRQMAQDAVRLRVVDVVQEAVDEHAIEARAQVRSGRDVRHPEVPPVAAPRVGDVARVDVNAQIVGVSEMAGGCFPPAAPNQHAPPHPPAVVRGQRGPRLFGAERPP